MIVRIVRGASRSCGRYRVGCDDAGQDVARAFRGDAGPRHQARTFAAVSADTDSRSAFSHMASVSVDRVNRKVLDLRTPRCFFALLR